MESKIVGKFPKTKIEHYSSEMVYVADFTERTGSERGIEISDACPKCPLVPEKDMDVITICNPSKLDVVFAIFDDNSFKKDDGINDEGHTEGAFFVNTGNENDFFALYEIKDCKVKNMADFKINIKSKVINSASVMRINGIVSQKKMIIAFASFPKRKVKFNNYFSTDIFEMKKILKEKRINFYCSNDIIIENSSNVLHFMNKINDSYQKK